MGKAFTIACTAPDIRRTYCKSIIKEKLQERIKNSPYLAFRPSVDKHNHRKLSVSLFWLIVECWNLKAIKGSKRNQFRSTQLFLYQRIMRNERGPFSFTRSEIEFPNV
ncbi:Uncharacterised protein [Mycobacteroides abscessus subsp. abscessus]|nr:Uncharacterised protein [Mycobacteroides abscessus subsp. abscessus]